MYTKQEIEELRFIAEEYRDRLRLGFCNSEEAKEKIMPYINAINEKSKEIAKKYSQKPRLVQYSNFVR